MSHLLAAAVGTHFLVVLLRAIGEPALHPWSLAGPAMSLALMLAVLAAGKRAGAGGQIASASALRIAIGGAFLASRLVWAACIDPEPVSDFAGYYSIAHAVGRGKRIYMPWPNGASVASWGYSIALGLVFRVVPDAIPERLVARLFNVALGCTSLFLLERLVRRIAGMWPALIAMALFALWPAQLYLTALLATENLAVVALLGAMSLALGLLRPSPMGTLGFPEAVRSALIGVALAACIAVRAALIGVVPAFVVAILRWRRPVWGGVTAACVLSAFFLLGSAGFTRVLERVYESAPFAGVWWSALTGTNLESNGSFSAAERDRFFAHASIEEANAFARVEIAQRLRSHPAELAHLGWTKTVSLWLSDDYAVFWGSTRSGSPRLASASELLDAAAQTFHLAVLALAIVGCALLTRGPPAPGTDFILLTIICGTLLHAIAESQARYHFVLEPLAIALASIGLRAFHPLPFERAARQSAHPSGVGARSDQGKDT